MMRRASLALAFAALLSASAHAEHVGTTTAQTKPMTNTVAGLTTCNAGAVGLMATVSDGTASLAFGATVTGAGSTKYLVWCNAAAWTVIGK